MVKLGYKILQLTGNHRDNVHIIYMNCVPFQTFYHIISLITFNHTLILISFFGHVVCGILSQPGVKPMLPALEAWSPNHWATREGPLLLF